LIKRRSQSSSQSKVVSEPMAKLARESAANLAKQVGYVGDNGYIIEELSPDADVLS